MAKPATPLVWASGKTFSFQPNSQQQAQGYDYLQALRQGTPITDDHDFPFNQITTGLKWVMDQIPEGGIAALLTALLPKRTFLQRDFIRIPDVPGGLIVQWVDIDARASSGTATVLLPTPMPSGINAVVATRNGGAWSQDTYWNVEVVNNSSFIARMQPSAASFSTGYYIAIGN